LFYASNCSALLLVAKLEHVFEKATRLMRAIFADAPEGENILHHMRFDAPDSCLILACAKGAPVSVLYWGAALPLGVDGADLERLSKRQGMHGVADMSLPLSLAMEPGLGHPMFHGFAAHRAGKDWGSVFAVAKVEPRGQGGAKIICRDERTRLGLEYEIDFDGNNGVLRIRSTLTNYGATPLDLNDMIQCQK
jgi:hypothetical protein